MVGRRRAARQHQLGQRELGGDLQLLRLQPRPDRIERRQPGKQLLVDGLRVRAGQRLVEMMMGVDQPRQHDMAAGVERGVHGRGGRGGAGDQFDDAAVLDDEAALGACRENR